MVATRSMTIPEFEALGSANERFELIRGVLREVPPMGMRHGEIGSEFHWWIATFVRQEQRGRVYTSDTHFILTYSDSPVIVMPDVSFVRADRLPPLDRRDRIAPVPPDLAVEVRSPTDERADIEEKIALYRETGLTLLWYCEPKPRIVTVYRGDREPFVVDEASELDGEDVLPGFRLHVGDVFVG